MHKCQKIKHIKHKVGNYLALFVCCVISQPGDMTQSCGIVVEPVSRRQRLLPESVEVCLKGVLQGWDASSLTKTSTESWVLQCSSSCDQEAAAFQHLLMELSAHALHMVRHPNTTALFYTKCSHANCVSVIQYGCPSLRLFCSVQLKLKCILCATVCISALKFTFYIFFVSQWCPLALH